MALSRGIALVTGAGGGIGRAIALRLADDGFDVAVSDLGSASGLASLKSAIIDKGRRAFVSNTDVSNEAEVQDMTKSVVDHMGGLDVMVANAGICIAKPFIETTIGEWDKIFAVNGRGVFLCYKYAAQQMIAQGRGGRIIGASSVAGKQGEGFLAAYSATKFAVRGLTQATARELGKHGITVNAYAPGVIDTPMLKYLGDASGGADAFYAKEADATVVGRVGTPEDIAGLVSYLASKEASFITGQSVSLNGGRYFD